jgi:hypothetical protein
MVINEPDLARSADTLMTAGPRLRAAHDPQTPKRAPRFTEGQGAHSPALSRGNRMD